MKWIKCNCDDVIKKGHYAFILNNKLTGIKSIKLESRESEDCVLYIHATHYCEIELPKLNDL